MACSDRWNTALQLRIAVEGQVVHINHRHLTTTWCHLVSGDWVNGNRQPLWPAPPAEQPLEIAHQTEPGRIDGHCKRFVGMWLADGFFN